MTRVTENSNLASVNFSIGKTKSKLEDLQSKGASLRRITRPSDDPIGNIELLSIRAQEYDSQQLKKNVNFAITKLEVLENSLTEMADIIVKAKEISIAQASDLFNPEIRRSISKEVNQLRNQLLGIANRRFGSQYIFSGYATLTKPFDDQGKYFGDNGQTFLEISKDVYVPTNIPGTQVFYELPLNIKTKDIPLELLNPDEDISKNLNNSEPFSLSPQKTEDNKALTYPDSIFDQLRALENGLLNADSDAIQGLLERLDSSVDRLTTLRTKIGSWINSAENAEQTMDDRDLINAKRKTYIEDADVAQLFSDLNKQQQVLKASYKISSNLLNDSLLNFLR